METIINFISLIGIFYLVYNIKSTNKNKELFAFVIILISGLEFSLVINAIVFGDYTSIILNSISLFMLTVSLFTYGPEIPFMYDLDLIKIMRKYNTTWAYEPNTVICSHCGEIKSKKSCHYFGTLELPIEGTGEYKIIEDEGEPLFINNKKIEVVEFTGQHKIVDYWECKDCYSK